MGAGGSSPAGLRAGRGRDQGSQWGDQGTWCGDWCSDPQLGTEDLTWDLEEQVRAQGFPVDTVQAPSCPCMPSTASETLRLMASVDALCTVTL